MSQVDMVGDTLAKLEPASSKSTGTKRRAGQQQPGRKRRWVAAVVLVAAIVVTVVVVQSQPGAPPPAARVARVALPPPASATAPATIFSQDQWVSDPAVLIDGHRTYLYTTGLGKFVAPHIPVRVMNGTTTLAQPTDAMPTLPSWSWGWLWAPDVMKVSSHRYVMWFSSEDVNRTNPDGVYSECIGNATSDNPLGPFVPAAAPVICQQWGSIDPRIFTAADGKHWILWKADNNADHAQVIPTTIWSQRLGPTGTTLLGQPKQIAAATQPWEQGLIEAPDLVRTGNKYYLFFSGNSSNQPTAGIGYQTCKGVQGPCTDTRTTPLLTGNAQGQGPSEESLFTRNGVTWLLYTPTAIYQPYQYPYMAVARVAFGPHGPYLAQFDGKTPSRP
ncbi:MAG TPA: glycoside hydrolase family 43 protein [Acidimicrobiales bacterium]|nr:glycoside hydrolase family 43 protein [Acidimicrobiales bacterium]